MLDVTVKSPKGGLLLGNFMDAIVWWTFFNDERKSVEKEYRLETTREVNYNWPINSHWCLWAYREKCCKRQKQQSRVKNGNRSWSLGSLLSFFVPSVVMVWGHWKSWLLFSRVLAMPPLWLNDWHQEFQWILTNMEVIIIISRFIMISITSDEQLVPRNKLKKKIDLAIKFWSPEDWKFQTVNFIQIHIRNSKYYI